MVCAHAAAASKDHPRSRGVYTRCHCQIETMVGSSPLARGLLDKHQNSLNCTGIIPARAGFTNTDYRGRLG